MIYELLLAESQAILFGSTIREYSLSLGVFLCSLGLGAIFVNQKKSGDEQGSRLVWIEVALALFGAVWVPFIFFLAGNHIEELWIRAAALCGVFLIGILTGMELPLCGYLKETQNQESLLLASDYFGSVAGAFLFTAYSLPVLGMLGSGFLTAAFNATAGLFIAKKLSQRVPAAILALSCVIALFYTQFFEQFL
jgi:spermidine synthase